MEKLRNRQIKNFLTVTLLSLGVPMFVMGDEVRRTQRGNNNAYCQDNELSWFDWSLVEKHADLLRFVRLLVARRALRDIEHERVSLSTLLQSADKAWHGVQLNQPDWSDNSFSVALTALLENEKVRFELILNAYWKPLDFELPVLENGLRWRRWIDTALDAPHDIVPGEQAVPLESNSYRAEARSVVMLISS